MAKNNIWMSVSDLMTGLMVIFLFIAIAYMIRVRDDISEYKDTKEELYFKLKNKFSDSEIANGTISVNPDQSFLVESRELDGKKYILIPNALYLFQKIIPTRPLI